METPTSPSIDPHRMQLTTLKPVMTLFEVPSSFAMTSSTLPLGFTIVSLTNRTPCTLLPVVTPLLSCPPMTTTELLVDVTTLFTRFTVEMLFDADGSPPPSMSMAPYPLGGCSGTVPVDTRLATIDTA